MLRTKEKHPSRSQRLVSQTGSWNTPSPVQHPAISQPLSSVVPSSSERFDSGNLSDAEKGHIYDEWTRAGKPHNLVCSACRSPRDLISCETCCRSYHAHCLPSHHVSISVSPFYCPSCRHKRWDRSPPQLNRSAPSSNASQCSTSGVNGYSRVSSPREHAPLDRCQSLAALGLSSEPTQALTIRPSPDADRQLSEHRRNFPTTETDTLSRAKKLLVDNSQLHAGQDVGPGLLPKLESMITELETRQSLHQEIQELKAENVALRNENANFRAYFASRLPTNEPIINPINSSSTSASLVFPKPSSDTIGMSWDRIVMDII
ncbi:hypothetical protein BDV26DRAFT_15386 [Aspergillus bertholletiae]|uniref:PHD-type domain-containing protein n=1 Tax=Aspergillus bertholletiae TaxID=1226010 RepID=A0A5N7BL86_9EURO|nr:hypothetical protein BDV26DRAFT_15386 [Aspergillus bertholletiae]